MQRSVDDVARMLLREDHDSCGIAQVEAVVIVVPNILDTVVDDKPAEFREDRRCAPANLQLLPGRDR